MPQLSLYVTDENLVLLRENSKRAGVSMSKYANRLIEEDAGRRGWPQGFWDLYGAIDGPFVVPDDPPPSDDAEFEQLFA